MCVGLWDCLTWVEKEHGCGLCVILYHTYLVPLGVGVGEGIYVLE